MVEYVEVARSNQNTVVMAERHLPSEWFSVNEDLCPGARTDGDRVIVAVFHDGMFFLHAETIDENFWKRSGLLVANATLPLFHKVDDHVRQLGIFI